MSRVGKYPVPIPAGVQVALAGGRITVTGKLGELSLALTDKGLLAADPELDLIGIPERDRDGALIEDLVYDTIEETFETMPRKRRTDPDAVAEAVRRAVRSMVNQRWGKKPMGHVHILAV